MVFEKRINDIGRECYALVQYIPCCDGIREAYDDEFIGIGDLPDERLFRYDPILSIYKSELNDCSDTLVTDFCQIFFCPFCGTEIDIKIIKTDANKLKEEKISKIREEISSCESVIRRYQQNIEEDKKILEELQK